MDKVRQDISQHFVKFSFSALNLFAVVTCSCGIIVIVKYETMSSYFPEPNKKRKCESLNNTAKKLCFNEKLDTCIIPSNANELTMEKLPKHMIHLGGLVFISVNCFQKQTRVHIRLYAKDDTGVLHPTKDGVSLKPEVWSAFHSQLCSFRCRENFESAIIVKRDICLFNLSDKESECVSIQRLFQRKDLSFQFVPERVLLNGENLGKLRDSYELVFECVKNKLLTYTLCEYIAPEVDRLPENELSLNYDADNPFGLYELTDSLCRCITKYIADNISLYLKLDCDVCQNDYCVPKIHECINVKKKDSFEIYFERALYNINWHAFAVEFVNLNKNNPHIKHFSNEIFDFMEVEKVFKKVEDMYVNDYTLDLLSFDF
ncbi:PC4 domain-containing protein [Nephila pilipes]|uniref:PC4 domain-containing protein n=1 Tax=Nephila pilipes TaxID=299642 RepID=A0A8X6QZ65_NEPPI|nr:PC4 domain-containing protein [Nephila pilipes]